MAKVKVEVVKRFTLNGTIDGHDPIGVTFRIVGPRGAFWLTVVSVNWGRGYAPGEFKANVLTVLDHVDGKEHVVLFIQELDEADKAPEKQVFRHLMEPGTTLIEYDSTREPIAVSPGDRVVHPHKTMTMDQGTRIGAPEGTGPRRYFVMCTLIILGVRIGLGNTHPHRNMPNHQVELARKRGERIMRHEIREMLSTVDLMVWGGDMNDNDFPKMHPDEVVAHERGLDTIRYILAG